MTNCDHWTNVFAHVRCLQFFTQEFYQKFPRPVVLHGTARDPGTCLARARPSVLAGITCVIAIRGRILVVLIPSQLSEIDSGADDSPMAHGPCCSPSCFPPTQDMSVPSWGRSTVSKPMSFDEGGGGFPCEVGQAPNSPARQQLWHAPAHWTSASSIAPGWGGGHPPAPPHDVAHHPPSPPPPAPHAAAAAAGGGFGGLVMPSLCPMPLDARELMMRVASSDSLGYYDEPDTPRASDAARRLTLHDFEPLALIGRGAFGEVGRRRARRRLASAFVRPAARAPPEA